MREWSVNIWVLLNVLFNGLGIFAFFRGDPFETVGLLLAIALMCSVKYDTARLQQEISRGKVWFDK